VVQFVCVSVWHDPSAKQQAPLGWGQGLGVQLEPLPWYVPPCVVQLVCVSTWHEPSAKQQVPVGCGHGLGSQVVPSPW